MNQLNRKMLLLVAVAVCVCAGLLVPRAYAPPSGQPITLGAPTLQCVPAMTTMHTIKLQVCAGTDGAPFGFSVQWVREDVYAAGPDGELGTGDDNTWPASDSGLLCKASFSGRPAYNDVPGCDSYTLVYDPGCTDPASYFEAEIGNLNDDDCGVSFNVNSSCGGELDCGTTYRFRAFSHAGVHPDTGQKYKKSAFSSDITCETETCPPEGFIQCTWSQGFWKTHEQSVINVMEATASIGDGTCGSSSNPGLCMGTGACGTPGATPSCYDVDAVMATLNRSPSGGNRLVQLAHQYIAARLNLLYNGGYDPVLSNGFTVTQNLTTADSLIGSLNIVTDFSNNAAMNQLAGVLEAYNLSFDHAIGCIEPLMDQPPSEPTGGTTLNGSSDNSASKDGAPKLDAPKTEAPKPIAPKADAPKADSPKPIKRN